MCARVRRVLNISLSTSRRVTDKPAILLLRPGNRVIQCYLQHVLSWGFRQSLQNRSLMFLTLQVRISNTQTCQALTHLCRNVWQDVQEATPDAALRLLDENTRGTPAVTISDIMPIEAWDTDATMLILYARKGQKLNTLHDVVPPDMPQTYTPCMGWRKALPSWISFKYCSLSSQFILLERSRCHPLNSEPIHLEHSQSY